MKSVAEAFGRAGGTNKATFGEHPRLGMDGRVGNIPGDLALVANNFVDLQQKRYIADYALGHPVRKDEALQHVERAVEAIKAWDRIQHTDEARLFLDCLTFWETLKRRD